MLWVVCHRSMGVAVPELVHPVMQAAMGGRQYQTHSFVGFVLGPRADRVQVGQCSLDLFENGDGIRCGDQE